jgi:translocation and assembly module TamB
VLYALARQGNYNPRREIGHFLDLRMEAEFKMNITAPVATPAPRKRWPRRLLWCVGAIALVWFAPAIIANSPWRDYAINLALGKFNGRVVTSSASLGWFSQIKVSGLRIDDTTGKPLLQVAEIQISETLFSLLRDQSNLGEIRLDKPSAHLVLSENSSNLEDALEPLLSTPGSATTPRFSVFIDGGAATLDDEVTGKSWEIRDLVAELNSKKVDAAQFSFNAKGAVLAGGAAAAFESTGEVQQETGPDDKKGLTGELKLLAAKLPLDAMTPWLRRTSEPIRVEGELSGAATYSWTANGQHALAFDKVTAETLAISAPQQLGAAKVQLSQISTHGKLALDSQRVAFEGFALQSTAANLNATGGASLALLKSTSDLTQLGALLRDEDLSLHAEFDIAEAARAFPALLHIREGTEVKSGKVHLSLNSDLEGKARAWSGEIKTDALSAVNQGKLIRWEKPIDIAFRAHQGKEGIVVDQFQCKSSFLNATGTANAFEGQFSADADLSSLHSELSQFADLGDLTLRGKMEARIDWRQARGNSIQVVTDAHIENFEIRAPNQKPWEERELTIKSTVSLGLRDERVNLANSGDIALASGGDRLSVVLLSPVDAPFNEALWPVRIEAGGKLETWKTRLQNIVPLSSWELAGQFTANAEGALSSKEISWKSATASAKQLRAIGERLYIQEPEFKVDNSKGSIDFASGEVHIEELTAIGVNISLLAENVVMRSVDDSPQVMGRIDYEANLGALQAWTHHPQLPPNVLIQGKAKGVLIADSTEGVAKIDYSTEIAPLTLIQNHDTRGPTRAEAASTRSAARNQSIVWREPKMFSKGRVEYEPTTGNLNLEDLEIHGDGVKATIGGLIRDIADRGDSELTGEYEYDADKLSPRLSASSGLDLRISGQHREKFTLRGPIYAAYESFSRDFSIPPGMIQRAQGQITPVTASNWPREMQLDAGFGWSKAAIAGISTGQIEIDAKVRDSVARMTPLEVRLDVGTVRLNPLLDLSTRPYLVRFAPGPVIENAAITPQLCRSWLKYVNPLMADVTEVEGEFSLSLGDSAFPLAQPMLGQANGTLSLQQAQVGPGPLSRELIEIGKQVEAILKNRAAGSVKSWLTMPQQDVRFALQGGRVFHEQITFQARDVTITTRGSVDLDQRLELLAEVPIKDEWIEKEKFLAGLRGQSLQIPIGGTLTEPKVDARAITDIGSKLIGGTIRNKIDEEIEKGLQKGFDKLLRPKK